MIFQYYLVYIVVNVVCLAFAFVVLTRLTSSVGSEQENRLFRMMLVMYMAFLVCEIVWAFGVGNILPVSPHATSVIKLVGTIFIPVMVYFWLQYAEIGFGNSLAHTKKFKMITFIPAGIMLLVYLSNPATGLIATIQPDGTIINGPMRALTGLIDNIYGIAVIVHAVILLVRNRNPLQTRTYVTHIMFIVI